MNYMNPLRLLGAALLCLAPVSAFAASSMQFTTTGSELTTGQVPAATSAADGHMQASSITDDQSITTLTKAVALSGTISPTALSGNVNDYNPTGLSTASAIRIDGGAADRDITGLAGGVSGRLVTIVNIGTTNSLVLKNNSGSSSAGNKFLLGADLTRAPDAAVTLRYDGTSSVWRPITTDTGGSGSTANYCDIWITGASTKVSAGACGTVSSGTWTTPSWLNSTTVATIEGCGGGGGAGGATTAGRAGVGGAAGGLVKHNGVNLFTASTGYAFVTGAAGTGGVGSGAAGAATNSTLDINGPVTLTGGLGGAGASDQVVTYAVSAGGTATNGNVANITGLGGTVGNPGLIVSTGGAAPGFGSPGAANLTAATNGNTGTGFCSGGSGARSSGSSQTGGNGTGGVWHIVLAPAS